MKRIVGHDPNWARHYQDEANALCELLGSAALRIHHMGSTSIPNIPAKPIIDILLEATSLNALDETIARLVTMGYEARGEYGISGRRYFKKNSIAQIPAFHLHCYEASSYEIKRHLAFRDYLRCKPDIAQQYADIKIKLSDENGRLAPEYQMKKKPFVDGIALEALIYFGT